MDTERNYNEKHCWQYDIRLKNLKSDLEKIDQSFDEISKLKVSDFKFKFISKDKVKKIEEIKKFINKNEWLGKMPQRYTHIFVATYNGLLAGVVIMATPNAFCHLLGEENIDLEKLISRGACASWTPKGLASWLITRSIDWMVKNTEFRFFTAYSDTEAKELGTIYQACNFIYLGKKSGARCQFFDEENPQRGWFSGREFRKVSSYRRYAKELNIQWSSNWNDKGRITWEEMPLEISSLIKGRSKRHMNSCVKRMVPRKHKYVQIKGSTKRQTKELIEVFKKNNPQLAKDGKNVRQGLSYPKVRGE